MVLLADPNRSRHPPYSCTVGPLGKETVPSVALECADWVMSPQNLPSL